MMVQAAEISIDDMTPKQRQVMDLACDHYTYKEIGRQLDMSPRTVEGHMDSVRARLGAASRQDALRIYGSLQKAAENNDFGLNLDRVNSPGGFDRVDESGGESAIRSSSENDLVFRDAAYFDAPAPWRNEGGFRIPEIRPADIGPVGRLTAILVLAVLTASVLLVGLTIAATLGEIV